MDTELAPQHMYLYRSCSIDSTRLSFWVMWCTVIVPSGGPVGKLPGAPTCTGHQAYTGMISSMVFWNSGSHTRRHFFENYPQFRLARLKMFATTVLGRRNVKSIGFNPLTPELNPFAQRCMTRFLLGILLLEPCISLIYAWKTNKCSNYSVY
jgi:hypothetical protein